MSAIALEAFAIFGLIFAQNPLLIGIYFLIHQIVVSLILFNLDVFLESESTDETKTGGIRGMYLTLANITLVIAPMLVGFILGKDQFGRVYFFSLLFLIPLFILARRYFRDYKDVPIAHIKVKEAIITFLKVPNLFKIFMCHLTLQLFYAIMIIYMPVHLNAHIGFSWEQIGIMFTIMLLPFALFELPIGKLADNVYGEKEILTIGFLIMGLATLCISFITAHNFILWTTLLFLTRTGASFVEITSDSFFFKQVNQNQTDEISIYRTTRPLGFIVGPIAATFALKFLPYNYIFLFLGITVILGTYWSLALKDTR
jgi:MFS-type transporter involved in bile tolerance (Atg22 family)